MTQEQLQEQETQVDDEKTLVFSSDEEEEQEDGEVSNIEWHEYILPFGKHKGKDLNRLLLRKKTRGYMRWLAKQDWVFESHRAHLDTALKIYKRKKRKRSKVTKSKYTKNNTK